MLSLGSVGILLILTASALSACPHTDTTLAKFSETYSDYDATTDIVITEAVLLDVSDIDVGIITVKDDGKLVFNQGQSIKIKTKGIHVKDNAALIIGSSDCRHEDEVNIVLKGTRTTNRDSLGTEGEKYIAATDNAVVQIYGQEKLAWTKLSSTINRYDHDPTNVVYIHSNSEHWQYEYRTTQGIAIYIFNENLEKVSFGAFNIGSSRTKTAIAEVIKLMAQLSEVENGNLVVLNVQRNLPFQEDVDLGDLFDEIEIVAGMTENTLLLRTIEEHEAFSMVFVKGDTPKYEQALGKPKNEFATSRASIEYQGCQVTATSNIKEGLKMGLTFLDVKILKLAVQFPIINVVHDISSWKVGDEVLLTSTDYSYEHGEVRTIKEITGTNTITLAGELEYRHFGEIEKGVDMRGEVALLTRNVKIEGEMQHGCPTENKNCDRYKIDTYGGHIKVYDSFGSVHIEGAELQHMGQMQDKGNYPIHFHMCKNITGKHAMIKANSIHDTFSRAITVHGTFGSTPEALGVQIINNVAYNIFGHTYFLEDGAEMATSFIGNLGALTKNAFNDFVTDLNRATTFWITNPKVIMIGNVAAGSQGFGIWYTFPLEPVGPSEGLAYAKDEAKYTPLWTFDNNVVHSNKLGGFNFDNILDNEDGKVIGCMNYEPTGLDFKWVKVQLVRLTAYKNFLINVWIRGGWFELINYSSAESKKGIQIAKASAQQVFVKKSIFLGKSTKNAEVEGYPDAVLGRDLGQYLGAVFHDGPTYYEDCWFDGFQPSTNASNSYIAGAIGFAPKNKRTSSVASTTKNMRFGFADATQGNRLFNGIVDESVNGIGVFESDESSTFIDGDGSSTTCPSATPEEHVQLVQAEKYLITENCAYRKNWRLAACKNHYAKLGATWTGNHDFHHGGQMRRLNLDDANDVATEEHDRQPSEEYMVITGSDHYYYNFQFTNEFPEKVKLYAEGVERGYSVVFSICLPEGAVIEEDYVLQGWSSGRGFNMGAIQVVDTLEEVWDDNSLTRVYIDGRMLYYKLNIWTTRDQDWDAHDSNHCAGGRCPNLLLTLLKEMAYTPCFTPSAAELSNEGVSDSIPQLDCSFPVTDAEPDWGAGDTLASCDGNYGEWSGWSDCCNDGTNIVPTTRYRLCDHPTPYGGGSDCTGVNTETGTCTDGCPVDGVWTEWARWTDCFCDGLGAGSAGIRTRARVCEGTANHGEACFGDTFMTDDCIGDCIYN